MLEKFRDPLFLVKLHASMTLFWAVMMPAAFLTGLISSVAFISVISIYANFAGHYSSWQAARTEVQQKKAETEKEKADEELHKHIEEIYERIVKDPRTG
jgi:hypothetical protein